MERKLRLIDHVQGLFLQEFVPISMTMNVTDMTLDGSSIMVRNDLVIL